MATETQKRAFVMDFRAETTKIIQAIEKAEIAIEVFVDKDYATGAVDEITNAHLAILGVTIADLVKGKELIDNLVKFKNNLLPAQADYGETFSKLRTDFGASAGTE